MHVRYPRCQVPRRGHKTLILSPGRLLTSNFLPHPPRKINSNPQYICFTLRGSTTSSIPFPQSKVANNMPLVASPRFIGYFQSLMSNCPFDVSSNLSDMNETLVDVRSVSITVMIVVFLFCLDSGVWDGLTWGMHPTRGGGGVLPYVGILGMCRARDPHFQPWISVPEHIIFTNYQKIRSGRHYFTFLADFAVPETIIFYISLILTRSSPPTAGSARTQSVRQRRGLAAGQSASQWDASW